MEEAIMTALITAITGQYVLLFKINSKIDKTLTKIRAEFKACHNHRLIFDGDNNE